eukprot:5385650-Amphidinium_carterae.1
MASSDLCHCAPSQVDHGGDMFRKERKTTSSVALPMLTATAACNTVAKGPKKPARTRRAGSHSLNS